MRNVRNSTFFAVLAVLALSASGQNRTLWRTAADIREGDRGSVVGTVVDADDARRQLQLSPDDDRYQQVTVLTDSVSTQYNGFGGAINSTPEIFTGSKGFSNLRNGDRIEVRGTGRGIGSVMADQVTLLGRSVAAPQTGIGTTRPNTSVSTPTSTNATADVYGRVEGVVRQLSTTDNRLVIETDRREMFTIRAASTTPVNYQGQTYRVSNLEVGDRIRVESDGGTITGREVRARSIDVVRSVQDNGMGSGTTDSRRVTTISGEVTRVDRNADVVRVDTGRNDVRVDVSRAADASGRRLRAADLQVGDRLDVTGNYSTAASDVFMASTVRFTSGDAGTPRRDDTDNNDDTPQLGDYAVVSLSGSVTESLQNSPTLAVKDRASNRTVHIFVTEDFVYRTKSGTYTTADHLNVGDAVLVKCFRDEDGNHIAQSIRLR